MNLSLLPGPALKRIIELGDPADVGFALRRAWGTRHRLPHEIESEIRSQLSPIELVALAPVVDPRVANDANTRTLLLRFPDVQDCSKFSDDAIDATDAQAPGGDALLRNSHNNPTHAFERRCCAWWERVAVPVFADSLPRRHDVKVHDRFRRVSFEPLMSVPGCIDQIDPSRETPPFLPQLLEDVLRTFSRIDDVKVTVFTFANTIDLWDCTVMKWRRLPSKDEIPSYPSVKRLELTLVFAMENYEDEGPDEEGSGTGSWNPMDLFMDESLAQCWLERLICAFPRVEELHLRLRQVIRDGFSDGEICLDLGRAFMVCVRAAEAEADGRMSTPSMLRVLSVDTGTDADMEFPQTGVSSVRGISNVLRACPRLRELDVSRAKVSMHDADWTNVHPGWPSLKALFLRSVGVSEVRRWSMVLARCPDLEHVGVARMGVWIPSCREEGSTGVDDAILQLRGWPFSEEAHAHKVMSGMSAIRRYMTLDSYGQSFGTSDTLSEVIEAPCIKGAVKYGLAIKNTDASGDLPALARPLRNVPYLDLRDWRGWDPEKFRDMVAYIVRWIRAYLPHLRAVCFKAAKRSSKGLDVARHVLKPGHDTGEPFLRDVASGLGSAVGISVQICRCRSRGIKPCKCELVHLRSSRS